MNINDVIAIPNTTLHEDEIINFIKVSSLKPCEKNIFKCINLLTYRPKIFKIVFDTLIELNDHFEKFINKSDSWKIEEPTYANENLIGAVDLTGMYVVFNAEYYPQILFDPITKNLLIYDFFQPEIQGFLKTEELLNVFTRIEDIGKRIANLNPNSIKILIEEEYRKVAREIRNYDYFRIDRRINVPNSGNIHLVSVSTAANINTPNADFDFCWKLTDRSQKEVFSSEIIDIKQNGKIVKSTSYGHHCELIMKFEIVPTLINSLPVDKYTIPLIGICKKEDWKELEHLLELSEFIGVKMKEK